MVWTSRWPRCSRELTRPLAISRHSFWSFEQSTRTSRTKLAEPASSSKPSSGSREPETSRTLAPSSSLREKATGSGGLDGLVPRVDLGLGVERGAVEPQRLGVQDALLGQHRPVALADDLLERLGLGLGEIVEGDLEVAAAVLRQGEAPVGQVDDRGVVEQGLRPAQRAEVVEAVAAEDPRLLLEIQIGDVQGQAPGEQLLVEVLQGQLHPVAPELLEGQQPRLQGLLDAAEAPRLAPDDEGDFPPGGVDHPEVAVDMVGLGVDGRGQRDGQQLRRGRAGGRRHRRHGVEQLDGVGGLGRPTGERQEKEGEKGLIHVRAPGLGVCRSGGL